MTTSQAVASSGFINSIAVNANPNDTAGPYGNLSLLMTELKFLDINQVRGNQPVSDNLAPYETLAAQGVKFDFIIDQNPGVQMSPAELQSDLAVINQLAAATSGSIIGVEGLNEPYNFPNYWNGVLTNNWTVVKQVQSAEYAAVRADTLLSGVPILNTSTDPNSFANGTPPNMTSMSDLGNAHVYPYGGGQPPLVLNNILQGQSQIVPGKPTWVTEFGYSTAYMDPNYGVDQKVQAVNILNGLLDAYKAGVPKTFIYQLNDEASNPANTDVGNNWGLFNYNGTPKLAATAIHDLTTVLADSGSTATSFTPGNLTYTITNLPGTGDSIVMEKSNGTYDLVVWNQPTDWNAPANTEATVASTTTTITFSSAYASVKVYDPLAGTTPIASYTNTSTVQLSLTDHPLIVEVTAASPATPPPTTPPPTTPPPTTPPAAPSPNGTIITSASAGPIIDAAGNAWKLVQSPSMGLQIAVNGVVDTVTQNVSLLEKLNGNIVQENTSGNWYSEPGSSGPWTQIPAPAVTVTNTSRGTSVTVNAATIGTQSAYRDTFVLTAPGVAAVTLGRTATALSFKGLSSVSLQAGSAAASVTLDGGTNRLTGGLGALTVTAAIGADAYVYHAGDARMTINDFSFVKGDSLTVDAALRGAFAEKSNGSGGVLISFGTNNPGFALAGVSSVTSSQIHFV